MRTTLALISILAAGAGAHFAMAQQPPTPPSATAESPAAANVCAKLNEVDCTSKEGCAWLPGYKIPNGPDVAGYCRPSPRSIKARRAPAQ